MKRNKFTLGSLVLFLLMMYMCRIVILKYCLKNKYMVGVKIFYEIVDPSDSCIAMTPKDKMGALDILTNLFIPKSVCQKMGKAGLQLLSSVEYAVVYGNLDALKYFISRDKNLINYRNMETGYNLLQLAVGSHKPEIIEYLLDNNVKRTFEHENESLFYLCCFYQYASPSEDVIKTIKTLNKHNLDKNSISIYWFIYVVEKDHFRNLEYLVDNYEINFDYELKYLIWSMNTILENAVKARSEKVIKYFFKKGYDFNNVNEFRKENIYFYIVKENYYKLLEDLIGEMRNLEQKNRDEKTILAIAKENEFDECIRIIEKEMERRSKIDLKH